MASALTVIERLLDDDAVHDQLSKSVRHLREAASAGTIAVKRAAGTQPEPKRHRGLVFTLALAAAAGAWIAASRRTAPQH
jgi:uncharacterized protein YfiM (DUF2279 family)